MKICDGNIPPYPHIDGKGYSFPTFVEVKIDGEANVYAKGVLMSKASGKIRYDFPITNTLKRIVDDDTIIFGELHWGEGKAGALYDFLSHAKDDDLNFTIFDVHHPTLIDSSYCDRREWIINNIMSSPIWIHQAKKDKGCVRITRPIFIEDDDQLKECIQTNRDNGWEGVVIKSPASILFHNGSGLRVGQNCWVKLKHKTTGDYVVREIDPTLERMEVLVPMPNTNVCRIVGVKLVRKYKPLVNVGDVVEIEHQGQLAQGGLRHPTFAGKVVSKLAKGE